VISISALPILSRVPGGMFFCDRSISINRLSPAGGQLERSCAISWMQREFMMQICTSGWGLPSSVDFQQALAQWSPCVPRARLISQD